MAGSRDDQPQTNPMYESIADWIRADAIPFDLTEADSINSVIDRIVASLDDSVELLGVGEALHGGEEILQLRNRFFQRLSEVHGYSAIAIESSFPRGQLVNEYVEGRGAESFDALVDAGFSYGFGQLEANRELVEWMRAQNAEPSRDLKLRFYAFDLPAVQGPYAASPRQALEFALNYLDAMMVAGTEERRQRINALIGDDAPWENEATWRAPGTSTEMVAAASALRIETEDLMSVLRVQMPELLPQSGEDRYREAIQHVEVARQLLNFFIALTRDPGWAEPLGVRDALMADNLNYILEREHGRGKVFVFAHNAHLQRSKITSPDEMWPAGAHLHRMFGARYALIGTAIGVSPGNGVGQPEEGSIEARLVAAPGDARFIPTQLGNGLPAGELSTLTVRSKSTTNPSYQPLTGESFRSFDWLGIIDEVTPSREGPAHVNTSNENAS